MIGRIAKPGMAMLAMAAFSSSSMAMFVYTYTGNPFTHFINSGYSGFPPVTHDASDAITGFVAFTAPLGQSLQAQYVTPASYRFNDGVHTYTSESAPLDSSLMFFSTDALGHITEWNILMNDHSEDPSPNGTSWQFESSFAPSHYLDIYDRADVYTCQSPNSAHPGCSVGQGVSTGDVFDTPGRWVDSVPEPTTLWLLGGGLLTSLLYRLMRSRNIVGKQ